MTHQEIKSSTIDFLHSLNDLPSFISQKQVAKMGILIYQTGVTVPVELNVIGTESV